MVFDRAISMGGQAGPVCSEVRSTLYGLENRPRVSNIIGGLGGRDVTRDGFEEIINRGLAMAEKGSDREFEIYGVRE